MSSSEDESTAGSGYDVSNDKNAEDQTYELPDPEALQLPTLRTRLNRPENFDSWLQAVTMKLKEVNLHSLIDSNTCPPQGNTEAGKRWLSLSMKVTEWLLDNKISHELLDRLNIKEDNIVLADRFMKRAKEVLQIRGSALDALRLKRFREETDPEHFSTAERYILAYRHGFNTLRDNKMMPSPYTSLLGILQGLQSFNWFISANMYTRLDMDLQVLQKANPAGTLAELVDYDMFQKYVDAIIELVETPASKKRRCQAQSGSFKPTSR
ncbi:hypothetical protein N7528_001950 [Penicillium herquei]|nr:hypothetical protein N7528_001950 [Penicillium herquei]